MDKKIKVKFKLELKQLYEFTLYKKYYGAFGIGSLAIVILSGALLITGINQEGTIQKILLSLLVILFGLLIPYSLYRQSANYLASAPIYEKEVLYEIDDQTITIYLDKKTIKSAWTQVYKLVETRKSFFIYTQNLGTIILPKIYLDQDYDLLRSFIIRKLNKKQYKLK